MEAQRVFTVNITGEGRTESETMIATEFSLTIVLNGRELVTLLCSPAKLDCLAVGFLASEGLLKTRDEIKVLTVDEAQGIVRVETRDGEGPDNELLFRRRYITSAGGTVKGASFSTAGNRSLEKIDSRLTIAPRQVFKLVDEFQGYSRLFQVSRAVHSAALCDAENILVFADDLGRHNAIDKIFGESLLKGIPTSDRIVVTTGRVPSEQLLKVARRRVPLMVSLTVPTDLGVRLAAQYGITLIGSVRGKKMTVYTGDWRVSHEQA